MIFIFFFSNNLPPSLNWAQGRSFLINQELSEDCGGVISQGGDTGKLSLRFALVLASSSALKRSSSFSKDTTVFLPFSSLPKISMYIYVCTERSISQC